MFHRYLLEDQLTGKSSVQGYIRALQRGCRCLERECFELNFIGNLFLYISFIIVDMQFAASYIVSLL